MSIEMFMIQVVLFFIVGTVFGSFSNVVIYRLPRHENIAFPPSNCPRCHHELRPWDMIPILSWVLLKGKCRYCHTSIDKQYPIVEFLSGCIFVLNFIVFQGSLETYIACLLTILFLPMAVIDFKHCILPNKLQLLVLPIALGVAFLHTKQRFAFYQNDEMLDPLWGALIGGGILFVIAVGGMFLSHHDEVMGMGDIKLLTLLGLLCGVQNILVVLLIGTILTGCIGFGLIISKKKKAADKIAFGPYLIASFYLVIFLSQPITLPFL